MPNDHRLPPSFVSEIAIGSPLNTLMEKNRTRHPTKILCISAFTNSGACNHEAYQIHPTSSDYKSGKLRSSNPPLRSPPPLPRIVLVPSFLPAPLLELLGDLRVSEELPHLVRATAGSGRAAHLRPLWIKHSPSLHRPVTQWCTIS